MKTFVVESPLRLSLEESHKSGNLPFPQGILNLGWGNGYVIIPHWHWLCGVDYDEIDIEVHGGITFSGYVEHCGKWEEIPKNCHPKDYIVGFDTGHYGDHMRIWPKERVIEETEYLRDQLMPIVYPLLTSSSMTPLELIEVKLNYLSKYLEIKIELGALNDPNFPSFDEAFENRHSENYSIFFPHYCKSMQIVDGKLGESPLKGLDSRRFPNVVCFKFGNYYKGKWYDLSPWTANPEFKPKAIMGE